jgi:BlaR1 peptidase M56
VLLAPRGLSADLPRAERDAVLLHELAHVRRSDFAWNLVQRLVLAVLWFHPAAWAIYARLAREREASCDALAVRHGAAPSDLARALVRLAAGRTSPRLAMGLSSPGELTARVERLLGVERPTAPANGRRALAAAASAACLLALGAGRLGVADPVMGELYTASAFGPTISIAAQDPAGAFALRVRQGRVVAASIDARPLPADGIRQDGAHVILVGHRREPLLALTVTPQGRISWQPRTPTRAA